MDFDITALTTTWSALRTVFNGAKSVFDEKQSLEIDRAVLEVERCLLGAERRIIDLERQNSELSSKLSARDELVHHPDHCVYYRVADLELKEPICPICFQNEDHVRPLANATSGEHWVCHSCSKITLMPGRSGIPKQSGGNRGSFMRR